MEAIIDFGDDERGEDDLLEQKSSLLDEAESNEFGADILGLGMDMGSKFVNPALAPIMPKLQQLRLDIERNLATFRTGDIIRNGLRICLVGLPNAGKSSLLNLLARRPISIVSPMAGTTRDSIEVRLEINGVSCLLTDTAGLRSIPAPSYETEVLSQLTMEGAVTAVPLSGHVDSQVNDVDIPLDLDLDLDLEKYEELSGMSGHEAIEREGIIRAK